MRFGAIACVLSLLLVGATGYAQELPTARQGQKLLSSVDKNTTEIRILRPDLVPEVYQTALAQAAGLQRYFEALAISPTEGMLGKSGIHAINFHSAADAHQAAIAGCNKKKLKASKSCVVVAEFLPKGYVSPAAFGLSHNATVEFTTKYKRLGKSKAFAISHSTGNWGQAVKAASPGEAQAAALADCNAKPGGNGDCVVISAD